MANNEIIYQDGLVEEGEEMIVTKKKPRSGLKIAAGIGLAAIAGGLLYKKLIKPAIAKAKAAKEAETIVEDFDEAEDNGVEE